MKKKTLRDEIAIAAMAAVIAGDDVLHPDDKCHGKKTVSMEKTAAWAYEMSDVMLDARDGRPRKPVVAYAIGKQE